MRKIRRRRGRRESRKRGKEGIVKMEVGDEDEVKEGRTDVENREKNLMLQ